jgi:hypothetical protein
MAINKYSIGGYFMLNCHTLLMIIGGYFTLNYHKLLMVIGGYFINGY